MSLQAVKIRLPSPVKSVTTSCEPPPIQTDGIAPDERELRIAQMQEELQQRLAGLRQTQAALDQGVAQVCAIHEKFRAAAHEQLADMAVQIASKVLMQEIKAQRYEIDPIVQAALLLVPSRYDVTVRLNGDDLARCRLANTSPPVAAVSPMRFVADSSVACGNCIVECEQGIVESNIESHLADVAAALRERA